MQEAADGKAAVLVTTIWNFHWKRQGSKRVSTEPAIFGDKSDGSLWYRMGPPHRSAPPTSKAHWKRIELARQFGIPVFGVLKDYSTSRCSLLDTFKIVDIRDDVGDGAIWFQLHPDRPFEGALSSVDIRERTGSVPDKNRTANPEVLAIDSFIRPTASTAGQARLSDPERRRAIELYAMAKAIGHYQKTWPTVEDVSATESFDLRCRDRQRELRIEVKGTSTAGETILLTRNEVGHAQDPQNRVALFVVSGILVDATNTCSGGVVRVIEPWTPEVDRLVPLAYEYRL